MKIITVVLTLLGILLLAPQGNCQEAVLAPLEYVAYEGQGALTFRCTVTGPGVPDFVIRVDGEQLGLNSESQREITTTDTVQSGNNTAYRDITISATQLNEDTTIKCFGVVSSGVTNTAVATFKVQGLLEPVSQLTSEYHNQNLTWTPPPTLDITDLEPDITYRVCDNATNTCVDITDTSYTFPTSCFSVEYSVSACNPVGCSENETIAINFKSVQEPTEIDMVSTEFLYMASSDPIVRFIFVSDGNCTRPYRANFTGMFDRTNVILPPPRMPTVDENGTVIVTLTEEDGVVPNERFTGEVRTDQITPNGTEMVMGTIFTTFDVQETDVTPEGGSITVTCIFARGSEADGCRVFVGLSSIHVDAFRADNTSPTSTTTFNGLRNGTYTVYVVDIEADGSLAEYKPFSHLVTITDAPAPTPPGSTPAPSSPTVPSASPIIPTTDSSQNDSPIEIIGGVGVAGLVVILMIVAAVVAYLMWKKKKGKEFVSSLPVILSAPCRYEVPQTGHWIQGGPPGDPVVAAEPSKVEVEFVEEGYAEGLSNGTSPTPRHLHRRSQPPVVYSELQAKSLQAELGPCPTTDSLPDTVTAPEEGINLPGMVDASRSVSEEPSFQSSACETKPTLDSSSSPVLGIGPPVVSQALESMRSLPEISPPPLPPPRINTDEGAPPLPLRMEPSLTDSEPESPSNTANQKALKKDHEEGDPEQEPNDEKTPTQPVDASGGSVQYLTSDGKSHFEEHATKTRNLSTMYCLKTRAQQDVGREDTMELAGHEQQRSELQQRTGRNRQYDRGQDKDSCHDDDEIQELPSNYPIPSPSNGPDVSPSDHDGDEHVKAEDETRQHTCIAMEVKSVPPS